MKISEIVPYRTAFVQLAEECAELYRKMKEERWAERLKGVAT